MMKSAQRLVMTVGLLMIGSTGVAIAGPVGQTGSFSWTRQAGYFLGAGGEFSIEFTSGSLTNASYVDAGLPGDTNPTADMQSSKNIGAGNTTNFQTFCLEVSEDATTPSFFVVGSAAFRGSTTTSDPISVGTAWLYSQFAQGNLTVTNPPYPYAGNYFAPGGLSREAESKALQLAIWALEEESLTANQQVLIQTNPYYQAALQKFSALPNGARTNAQEGEYGVYVLINFTAPKARNDFAKDPLLYDKKFRSQDFLFYSKSVSVPDGGATLVMLGGALVGLGALRRRLKR
jgi:hypothetical protein